MPTDKINGLVGFGFRVSGLSWSPTDQMNGPRAACAPQDYTECKAQIKQQSDLPPLHAAIKAIGNPTAELLRMRNNIKSLLSELEAHISQQEDFLCGDDVAHMIDLENGETMRLMHTRWQKLYHDLWDSKEEGFDISKIPDVYDCCK